MIAKVPFESIPTDDRRGLALIRDLADDDLATFIAEIEKAPDSAPKLSRLDAENSKQAYETLKTMYAVRAHLEDPIEEFVSDIVETLAEEDETWSRSKAKFSERLTRLLEVDGLSIMAKGTVLRMEYERMLCSARILTDARPIYGDDVAQSPAAFMIDHTLKISYHEGAKMNEFYLALGPNGLKTLREVIERAEKKTKSLRDSLSTAKLRLIDPERKDQ